MQTETYITDSGVEIQVHFDDLHGEIIDSVDHSVFFGIEGFDANGTKYSATSEFCCGEFEGITDIEQL